MRPVGSCLFFLLALGCASAPPRSSAVEIRSGHAGVDGKRLYYEIRGEGAPVVLLHGGISTLEISFSKVAGALSRGHRIVGLERIGHGHTADTDRPWSYDEMAEDTAVTLRELGIGRADLVGWSDGGIVALLVASRHPELVRRVVISGVSTRLDGVQRQFLEWLRGVAPDGLAKVLKPELREAYARVSPDGPEHWPVVVAKARELWLSRNVEKAQLGAIDAEVLVIAGDRDPWATPEHSVEIFRSLRRARLWMVPGMGHDVSQDRPAWFLPVVTDFLDAPEKPAK